MPYEGDSHVEWFEGNFQDYEADKMRRLGTDSTIPTRIKYKNSAGRLEHRLLRSCRTHYMLFDHELGHNIRQRYS
jgi:hypothetical protein